jgi:hypothetical protein
LRGGKNLRSTGHDPGPGFPKRISIMKHFIYRLCRLIGQPTSCHGDHCHGGPKR